MTPSPSRARAQDGVHRRDTLRLAQLAFFRDPFVPLVQIPDPIFQFSILALWKKPGYLVSAVRGIQAARGWPIIHSLSDAEFMS
jgi:hypothetical protein